MSCRADVFNREFHPRVFPALHKQQAKPAAFLPRYAAKSKTSANLASAQRFFYT
jgi:hypothetical protein